MHLSPYHDGMSSSLGLTDDGRAEGGRRRLRQMGRIALLAAIGAIGLAVSGLGALAVYQTLTEGERARRADAVTTVVSAIRRGAEDAVRLTEATAALLEAIPSIGPNGFDRFADGWPIVGAESDAVRALTFFRRATVADLSGLMARFQAERVMGQRPDYPDFVLFPEGNRPVHFTATMVEPETARAGLYGYDLSADAARLVAAAEAAADGEARMSRPVTLGRDWEGGELSSLILAPVHPLDVTSSRGIDDPNLLGFAAVVFQPGRALAAALAEARRIAGDIDIAVADIGSPGEAGSATRLFESRTAEEAGVAEDPRRRYVSETIVAGRVWRVTVDPGPGAFGGAVVAIPAVVFGVGVLLTGALGLLVVRVYDSSRLMERRVRESTRSLRQIAEDLAASRDEAFRASAAKSEFLARMSHELRSPLTAILGFSEIIRDRLMGPLGTPVYAEYAQDIHNSGSHLLAIVSDLLDLSKIDAGRQTLEEALIDPAALLEELVRLNAGTARDSEITLIYRPNAAIDDRRLWADPRLVRQMVQNLVSNALKFTSASGTVTLWADIRPDGSPVLTVADTGIGMTPEQVMLARQPFTQIENVFQRTREGAGLGLALVDGMVRLHGGRFEIESAPGRGTTTRLVFPAERIRRAGSDPGTTPGGGGDASVTLWKGR